jgi:NAD(P)-dependent dehydrogenase (short-subunit alcohol dehydrogenase family)
MSPRLALVTGSNRGLGLGTVKELLKRDYEVILSCRDRQKGAALAESLKCHFIPIDVSDSNSIDRAMEELARTYKRLDVLVNNAGILPDHNSAMKADPQDIEKAFRVNTLGPVLLTQKALSLMKQNGYGRIVNVSSGMGQLSEMNSGYLAYRVSKTALNAVTKVFSEETRGQNILINAVCPGWVKTDMGGPEAQRSIEEGVFGIVWAATLPDNGPTGGYFRDGKPLAW